VIIIGEEFDELTEELEAVTLRIREITDEIRRRRREIDDIYDTDEIEAEDLRRADSIYDDIDELTEERERLQERQSDIESNLEDIRRNSEAPELQNEPNDSVTFHPVRFVARRIGRTAWRASSKAAKGAINKANPINKKINKKDTTDTGVESLRLEYRTVKKTKETVKTSRNTVRMVYRTPQRVVRTVRAVFRVTRTVVIHAAAIVINPMVWLALLVLVMIYFFVMPIVFIVGGGLTANNNTKSYSSARGMEITTEYPEAEEYYRIARDAKKSSYESMIDSMYYNAADLKNSDLVYMIRNDPYQVFDKNYATDDYKNALKGAWLDTFMPPAEAISIAYVWLEKQQNDIHGTQGQIYSVDFTQDVFDQLVDLMVNWSETDYPGQECPSCNCTVHIDYVHNPLRDELWDKRNTSVNAYNDWNDIIPYLVQHDSIRDGNAQAQYWNNNVRWRINNWILVYYSFFQEYPTYTNGGSDFLNHLGQIYVSYENQYAATPETIIQQTTTCDHQHTLHSIGLNLNPRDAVLTAMGFDDLDKQWVEMTYQGFLRNTDLVTVH